MVLYDYSSSFNNKSNMAGASSGTGTACPSGKLNACYDFE